MHREEKLALTRRLLAHVDNETTDYADSVIVVPFAAFDDPELHRKEVAAARRHPHIVAHGSAPSEPRTDKERRFFDKNRELLMQTVLDEDWHVAQTISRNVRFGGVDELIYGRNELPGQLFHKTLGADVRAIEDAEAVTA